MIIPPRYHINSHIIYLLQEIQKNKTRLEILPEHLLNLSQKRQTALLKSSLYSARIEGNPHTENEISNLPYENPQEKSKIELKNVFEALEYIFKNDWQRDITIDDLKQLHARVMKGIHIDAGQIRSQQSAIFNQAGIAIYVTPPPDEAKNLITRLLGFINNKNEEKIALIKAIIAHFSFEKIHPFLDGNGRVGRLLIHLILKKYGYDLDGRVAFEQFIDEGRESYYRTLNSSQQDVTSYIEFMLETFKDCLLKETDQPPSKLTGNAIEDNLSLRRLEMLHIIRDHKFVSFDFMQRRFMTISGRLLRYDLKKLRDLHLIKKRGTTRGVIYEAI